MLSLSEVTSLLNDKSRKCSHDIQRYRDIYYGMSLHIDGACPAFEDTRLGTMVYPPTWFGMEYQKIFEVWLFSKYPNESDETRNYRLSQYKPFQQEAFLKAIQVITGAIFQDSNYTIQIEDKEDSDYIWGENFEGKHLVSYTIDRFQDMCNDPNAWFVVIPKVSRMEQTGKVEPVIWFIPTTGLLYESDDEIIFEREDYMWLVNKVGYFRYRKEKDGRYRLVDGYYAHLLNRLPAYRAGGIRNSKGFHQSWLNAAKPIADEFVGEKSLSMLVNKQGAHPYMAMMSEDCPECTGGQIQFCKRCNTKSEYCNCHEELKYESGQNPNWRLVNCNACGGSGARAQDPAKVIIVPPDEMDRDPVKIISTNPEHTRVQFDNVKDVEKRILRALHLNYIEEAQSGVAKDKDLETRYQFLSLISNYLFDDLLYNWVKDILSLRNVRVSGGEIMPGEAKFTIIKPTQFSIKTTTELLEAYRTAYEGKVPDFMLASQLMEYADRQYGGDLYLKKKTEIIVAFDPLAVSNSDRIQTELLTGAIDQRDAKFHIQLPIIIDRIARERSKDYVIKTDIDTLKADIDAIFNTISPPPLAI